MVRKSRRELERALEDLLDDWEGPWSDLSQGVTAPFVTYEDDGANTGDAPAGWTRSTETDSGGPTYHVLERESSSGCERT